MNTSFQGFVRADMGLSAEKIAEAAKVSIGTVQKWLDDRLVTA